MYTPVLVKDCAYCHGLFKPRNVKHKFCRIECRKAARAATPYNDIFCIEGRQRRRPTRHAS